MLYFAENRLIQAIGAFAPTGSMFSTQPYPYRSTIGTNLEISNKNILPGQCQAFLTTSEEIVLFVEQWDILPKAAGQTSFEVPLVTFQNKKVYPAKVVGLNLALLGLSSVSTPVTLRWREGLIRYGSVTDNPTIPCLRPGYGETIIADLQRPLRSVTVQTTNLSLLNARADSAAMWGTLGRLMSMAFYVDPKIAAKYDTSTSKKKKKSLNSQDYEQIPTYPAYTPYVDNSGY